MSEHEQPDEHVTGEGADRLSPIHHRIELPVSRARAFDAYVNGVGSWWHPRYTKSGPRLETIVLDAHAGGQVSEVTRDGERIVWGDVLEAVQGERVVHTYAIAHRGDPSVITVTFADGEHGGTVVEFDHSGWNESNADSRAKFGDWPVMLRRYAEYATHQ